MPWLVDAMNVIGSRPDGWWQDRHAAMVRIVGLIERWAAEHGEDVTVVLEQRPNPPISSPLIQVTHAPRARANSADDEIIRLLSAHPAPNTMRVVTSDHWLAERASLVGASVESADQFRSRIEPR